jgi:hypothetical protein
MNIRRLVSPAVAFACVAAVLPGPARCFQLSAPGAGRGGRVPVARLPLTVSGAPHRRRPPPPAALRASADADADAGLSKEEKLRKYQQLAVEMTTKAKKLPPG